MSRWFPDDIQVALAPDKVVIDYGAGAKRVRQVLVTGSEAGSRAWGKALHVLAGALEVLRDRHGDVSVILSNSFVRYALVPQSNRLSTEQENAVLRHCFHEIYGAAAEHWALRLSAASGMSSQPASGVDQTLIDGLRTLFPDGRLRLRSIQPRLMAVCNQHRSALGGGLFWLLLVEPGNLCLGLISGGGLIRLRSLRSGDSWATELPWLLEREACLAELDDAPGDLLLWHRDGAPPARLVAGSLRIHLLQDSLTIERATDSENLAVVEG